MTDIHTGLRTEFSYHFFKAVGYTVLRSPSIPVYTCIHIHGLGKNRLGKHAVSFFVEHAVLICIGKNKVKQILHRTGSASQGVEIRTIVRICIFFTVSHKLIQCLRNFNAFFLHKLRIAPGNICSNILGQTIQLLINGT